MSTVLLLGFCYSIATLGEAGGFPYKSPRWSMTDGRVNAVITLQTTMMVTERLQIAAVVAAKRLPTVYGYREHVDAGALISQGGRSALVQVPGRELRTQNPYRHPAERATRGFPTRLEMVVNLKAAKAIGLSIPETFLVRADEVIE